MKKASSNKDSSQSLFVSDDTKKLLQGKSTSSNQISRCRRIALLAIALPHWQHDFLSDGIMSLSNTSRAKKLDHSGQLDSFTFVIMAA